MHAFGLGIDAFKPFAGLLALLGVSGGPSPGRVDLALVLAVDVSSSMNLDEQRAQRDGYAAAFRHPEVLAAIGSGPRGRIAIAYLEWAGPAYQQVIVPWTILEGPDDATSFADGLSALPLAAEAATSISGALASAGQLIATAGPASDRNVIDISGDGPNNAGPAVAPVRDWLVGQGITVNGLAISLPRGAAPDAADSFGEGYVAAYYRNCVIGGPGAFVISVDEVAEFEVAIRRKLVLEIAGLPARPLKTAYRSPAAPAMDCSTLGSRPGR